MKVLVTGASGFIGVHLLSALSAGGLDGLAVSRRTLPCPLPDRWRWAARDAVLLGEVMLRKMDCVIHLEVKQHVIHPGRKDLAEFLDVNVDGTQAWLDWCARAGTTRFVYVSSIKAVVPKVGGETDETAGGPPSSPYGASKWLAEERVRAWVNADNQRSALILRPAVIYGRGSTANIAAMVNAIRSNRFFLVGRNDNVKSLASVTNVVAAIRYLLPRMMVGQCECYNLADVQQLTMRQLDAAIRRILNRPGNSPTLPLPLAWLAAKIGDAFYRAFGCQFPINTPRLAALRDSSSFAACKLMATGFRPPQSVDDGLRELVANSGHIHEYAVAAASAQRGSDQER